MMNPTMLIEDLAVVAVIALFAWLVPMRRQGIPGLRGRGRPPAHPWPVPPRTAPVAEQLSPAEARDRDREQDRRILAELDSTWDAEYADRMTDQLRDHRDSA